MNDSRLSDSIFGEGEDRGQPAGKLPHRREPAAQSRAQARDMRPFAQADNPEGPNRRNRSCLVMALASVLVLGGFGLALKTVGTDLIPSIGAGRSGGGDYAGEGTGTVEVKVRPGDSGHAIGVALKEAGVVKSAGTFASVAGANPEFSKVQPGTYKMKKQMSSQSALNLLLDPATRMSKGVTVREGMWVSEIFATLSKQTGVPVAEYKKVDPKALGLPPAADGKLEGFLFPSTYEFQPSATASEQLKAMVALGKKQLNQLGVPADQLRKTVIVASFVQGESRLGADGAKVARVIDNREEKGMPLQMDSSIHYITQKRGTVTTTDKERNDNSPYNTYKHPGLPPGPINNPGLEALKAAAKPATGPWLYFVTVNQETGETKFETEYGAHLKNVREFQAWCRNNLGKC